MLKMLQKTRAGRQKTRVHLSLAKQARWAGEATAAKTLLGFYSQRAEATNPYDDWWAYADARQKQVDYQLEYDILQRKADEAEARVEAETAKLEKLK